MHNKIIIKIIYTVIICKRTYYIVLKIMYISTDKTVLVSPNAIPEDEEIFNCTKL